MTLHDLMNKMPLVAILRGLQPHEAESIGEALYEAGVRCAEVPLNSPEPLRSISTLREKFPDIMIGAGTVLTEQDVYHVAEAGGQFIVSPNTNRDVIRAAKRATLWSMPGFLTPSEAFAAIDAGADVLKLFPASRAGPDFVRAIREVLPPTAPVFAVGGVDAQNLRDYFVAGAAGFGVGGSLYRPGDTADKVRARATALVAAVRQSRA